MSWVSWIAYALADLAQLVVDTAYELWEELRARDPRR